MRRDASAETGVSIRVLRGWRLYVVKTRMVLKRVLVVVRVLLASLRQCARRFLAGIQDYREGWIDPFLPIKTSKSTSIFSAPIHTRKSDPVPEYKSKQISAIYPVAVRHFHQSFNFTSSSNIQEIEILCADIQPFSQNESISYIQNRCLNKTSPAMLIQATQLAANYPEKLDEIEFKIEIESHSGNTTIVKIDSTPLARRNKTLWIWLSGLANIRRTLERMEEITNKIWRSVAQWAIQLLYPEKDYLHC